MSAGSVEPYARFDAFDGRGQSWELRRPFGVVEAYRPEEVGGALDTLQQAVARGAHAGGYIAYEAAPGLDPALRTRPSRPDLPLVWFGLFAERHIGIPPLATEELPAEAIAPWRPALAPRSYGDRVTEIREWIAAGDTYQVNFTFPLWSRARCSDFDLYTALGRAQRARYCALLRLPGCSVLSISPELFFRWSGTALEMRPMKGTSPRGRWAAEDRARIAELHRSEKERAENLMIVDLLRNDAGRVSEFGSVEVACLFEVESYPTVHQLTSTVRARTKSGTSLLEVLQALFPSGSVTGAPKIRTMQLIAALEDFPRGVYTGAVGLISPGEAVFNVPIRTLLLRRDGALEMAVGSGITYDSTPESEYAECLQKAAFTRRRAPAFSLLETLRFQPGAGFQLLEGHLERMNASAHYFGYPFEEAAAVRALEQSIEKADEDRRVRLLLSPEGELTVESIPITPEPDPLRARISEEAVDSAEPLLYHKTTFRAPYEKRLAERPGYDEVLLVNERGEMTEFANGNLVIQLDGHLWTPPLECGLLPGVLREELLSQGKLRERVLSPRDLKRATAVFRINSVRGWSRAELEAWEVAGHGGSDG